MELHHSAMGFFREAVIAALQAQRVSVDAATEFYLVNLLVEFTRASNLVDEPLALRLARAAAADPGIRVRALKDVGDTSLYVSGFFAPSLSRRLVDVDYYVALGGSAYGQLAALLAGHRTGKRAEPLAQVFTELAGKFGRFVDVLGEVRAHSCFTSTGDLLQLCEEWLRTGDNALGQRLRAKGIVGLDLLAARKQTH